MVRPLRVAYLMILSLALWACESTPERSDMDAAGATFVESLPAPDRGDRTGEEAPAGATEDRAAAAVQDIDPALLAERRVAPIPEPPLSGAAESGQLEYRIGPLDVIEITVFGVPELAKTVQVTSRGQISLPLIGAVMASGKTPTELEADIAQRLGETYLQSPQVSVFVKESLSQRVTVGGAVAEPGVFPIIGQTTLLQAIAMGGGLVRLADPSGVVVFRYADGQRLAARFDIDAIGEGQAADPIILAGDVVIVDQSGVRSTIKDITDGLPIVSLFLPFLLL